MARRNKTDRPEAPTAAPAGTPGAARAPTGGSAGFTLPAAVAAPLMFAADRLNSVVMGVSLLAFVLVWVALGTFDVVLQAFDFTMLDWYVWWPFVAVLYFLCLNLTVVTFRRIPFNLPNLGVWVIHGSILLIAFGSTWFGARWVDAVTRIDKGRTQTIAYDQTDHGTALHVWIAGRPQTKWAPHADDNSGYSPNDFSEQYAIPGRLPQHAFRGGVTLTSKSISGLREAGVPEEVIIKLNRARIGKRWAGTAELLAALAETLTGEELEKHRTAITAHAATDSYAMGPIDAGGLRFTVNKVWPYVEYKNAPDEAVGDPHPAVLSALGSTKSIQQQTRVMMYAEDPLARRVEYRGEDEMLEGFTRILRPAYDALQRKDFKEHASALDMWQGTVNGVMADPPLARRLEWRREPTDVNDVMQVMAFFQKPPQLRDRQGLAAAVAAMGKLPFQPPAMVERVYILDPRLERPIPVLLEDWEKRREIHLDAAGLPGEKLVLEGLRRDAVGSAWIHYRAESAGESHQRMLLTSGLSAAIPANTLIDLSKVDKGNLAAGQGGLAQFEQAAMPITSKLAIVCVGFRTIAMQLVNRLDGRSQYELMVWSIEPGMLPRPGQVMGGQYGVPMGRDILPVIAYRYGNAVWKQTVTPSAVGTEQANRVLHITAEYDYDDESGQKRTWSHDFWIPKIDLPDIRRFETPEAVYRMNVPKLGPVEVAFAGRRVPLGPAGKLRAKLEHFQVEYNPGGSGSRKPREYSSFVTFTNPGDPSQTVKICMNEPKKADGWWFSQNSYDGQRHRWTVLSVAFKPMWSDPPLVPYAMLTLVCGVLWAFLVKPLILKMRRDRNRRAGADAAPGKAQQISAA